MNPSDEQKHAKRMMYLFLGICILCFIAMVTAITMHTLRWAFAAVLIGGGQADTMPVGEINI